MLKNYLKIAWRNLIKNKTSSLINIGGLAVGMAVAILISLWIWDEISFDSQFKNGGRIAEVMENLNMNSEIETWTSSALPLAPALRSKDGSDFKHVIISSWTGDHLLNYGNKTITKSGNFMEPAITDMLSVQMLKGAARSLNDPSSILLSQSTSKAVFGNDDPMNKFITIDKKLTAKVTGIYRDLPENSSFGDLTFIAPWEMLAISEHYATRFNNPWGASWFQTFVQIGDNADMRKVSAKIRNIKLDELNTLRNSDARFQSKLFLHPMSRWHLYGDFENGVNTGGRIQYVWLFGAIGVFVLLLACINFMNLSTARSEKRAREVGIRKAVGSLRSQLVAQFYSESIQIALLAFFVSILLVLLCLPEFNQLAGKKITILWGSPLFWALGFAFTLFTGLIAGSYPALYLSSFLPIKVLRGTFRGGRLEVIPRKILVVAQFTISVVLIIGTIVVFRQIQFAKNRPAGYDRDDLVNAYLQTDDIKKQYPALRDDLLASGVVSSVAESENQVTDVYITNGGFNWRGKPPGLEEQFTSMSVSSDFGKTVNWQIKQGRDFNPAYLSDSSAFVINETAVKFMGLKNPVGETVEWIGNGNYKIIGVVKDMVNQSAYATAPPMLFYLPKWQPLSNVVIKINPLVGMHDAISKLASIFKKYDPSTPFNYQFVDELYAKKFEYEERIGKLAGWFAGLAIFISCLGLFGMAMFMAERRTKEIGIRKVLGATVLNLWQLLSKDFALLIVVSFLIAAPAAYFFMNHWLQQYAYRTAISWWVFCSAGAGALLIALATVSFQILKAAFANPVSGLRSE